MKKTVRPSKTAKDARANYQARVRPAPARRPPVAHGEADVSIPQPLFQTVQDLAKQLNVSLSELYIAALTAYVVDHSGNGVTEMLDQLYATESSDLDEVFVKVQTAMLSSEAW